MPPVSEYRMPCSSLPVTTEAFNSTGIEKDIDNDDLNALLYIVVTLLFYSLGIIVGIITYLKREKREMEEYKTFEMFMSMKADPFTATMQKRVAVVTRRLEQLEKAKLDKEEKELQERRMLLEAEQSGGEDRLILEDGPVVVRKLSEEVSDDREGFVNTHNYCVRSDERDQSTSQSVPDRGSDVACRDEASDVKGKQSRRGSGIVTCPYRTHGDNIRLATDEATPDSPLYPKRQVEIFSHIAGISDTSHNEKDVKCSNEALERGNVGDFANDYDIPLCDVDKSERKLNSKEKEATRRELIQKYSIKESDNEAIPLEQAAMAAGNCSQVVGGGKTHPLTKQGSVFQVSPSGEPVSSVVAKIFESERRGGLPNSPKALHLFNGRGRLRKDTSIDSVKGHLKREQSLGQSQNQPDSVGKSKSPGDDSDRCLVTNV